MDHRIEHIEQLRLIGVKKEMSMLDNMTGEIARTFMQGYIAAKGSKPVPSYAVDYYPDNYFQDFDPSRPFEKAIAATADLFTQLLEGFTELSVPAGKYAVFNYKGKPSEAKIFFQELYTQYLPSVGLGLDSHPHLALMDEEYLGEHPESEELIFIPVL